jgi:hypothetical protein
MFHCDTQLVGSAEPRRTTVAVDHGSASVLHTAGSESPCTQWPHTASKLSALAKQCLTPKLLSLFSSDRAALSRMQRKEALLVRKQSARRSASRSRLSARTRSAATCNVQRATCMRHARYDATRFTACSVQQKLKVGNNSIQHAQCAMRHATCNMQHATCNVQHIGEPKLHGLRRPHCNYAQGQLAHVAGGCVCGLVSGTCFSCRSNTT